MADLLVLGLAALFFVATVGFISLCQRVEGK
jgi:hypothetical protein